jgi:hypothetical protein
MYIRQDSKLSAQYIVVFSVPSITILLQRTYQSGGGEGAEMLV